jgi:hypothetical protein
MARNGKINVNTIVAHARRQVLQSKMEVAVTGYRNTASSLGAVKKVQVSRHDPTVKSILEFMK